MKVLLVNGSPNEHGCTDAALCEVERTLREEGIETERFWIGRGPIAGCLGCGACEKLHRCVMDNDPVNRFLERAAGADGFVFGSPVHFAAAGGNLTCLMDRVFYAGERYQQGLFRLKPAACVVSARRGGTTAAFDQLNKYFTIREMPVVSSRYWNMVHGNTPDEVAQDLEGLSVMRVLGRNMAYLLRALAAAEAAGVRRPEREAPVATNFIR